MNSKTILITVSIALLFAGCVQSLHPLFTDKDLVFEPALIGTWAEEGTSTLWIFLKSGEKSYELIYTEKGTPAKFAAHLVRLGKFLFLDTFPESPDLKNDLQSAHLLNTHTFWKVWLDADTLRMTMLEHDWLKTMIEQKKLKIKHERLGERIVLTAPTNELQKFVTKYAESTKAFPKPEHGLIRQK